MMGLNTHTRKELSMNSETSRTLEYVINKFNLDTSGRLPVEIPNFGRNGLTEVFHELGFNNIVEVGVCDGSFSRAICKANPQAKIVGVDPFIAYDEYGDYRRPSSINKYHEKAKTLLNEYSNYSLLEKMSVEAARDFEDGSLDAVYIDANHRYEFVVADIHAWLPKIRKGGIISGHDYANIKQPTNTHVFQAVNGYTDSHQVKPWFLLGTKAMLPGEIRDSMRSWCWVV